MGQHAKWLINHGCTGIVTPGSLGESATLNFDEKLAIWKTVIDAVGERVPVVAAIASLSTAEAVQLAERAEDAGLQRLDGVAAVRLPQRLARDESAHRSCLSSNETLLHALQQSGRIRD